MTLAEMKKIIADSDPNLSPDDEAFKAQIVLLASVEVGPNIFRIARFTGYPKPLVGKFSHFLRKSQVWKRDKVCAAWGGKDGWLSFLLDTNVALGLIEKVEAH